MAKLSDILGINARSKHYLRLNYKQSRRMADSKLKSKQFLEKHDIPVPETYALFEDREEVDEFDWLSLNGAFVIKPVNGLGGEGILVVKKKAKYAGEWYLMDGNKINFEDLKLHANDILQGRYSKNNLPDKALVERRIKIHPKFGKIAKGGTPDIRTIVYNKVPVMAMLRVPTEESKGKSNLHQGAIGLGIDMATGITTYGVWHDSLIKYFPGTKKKVNGIVVPHWTKILEISSKIQHERPYLGYFGADILVDKDEGPQVIELNDQPGLSIQICNKAGLKRRLERVEGLHVETVEKGVNVAKTLFASNFARKVKNVGERPTVGIFETARVKPRGKRKKRIDVPVKIDTGAYSSSIDKELAKRFDLLKDDNVLYEKTFKSSLGKEERKVIMVDLKLRGKRVRARASVTDRSGLRRKMILGRRDLRDFLVDPAQFKPRDRYGEKIEK